MNIADFLAAPEASEAYITGAAGTGKTTKLQEITDTLNELKVTYHVVAYTHKAKKVLIDKLGTEEVSTLHSFLKKRPTINQYATNINALITSQQYGDPEPLQLLIVDEFSFVGEKDYYSIGELQERPWCTACDRETDMFGRCPKCETQYGKPLKVLYVGDPNQLPPVKDIATIQPHGRYHLHLTEVHRTNSDFGNNVASIVEAIEAKSGSLCTITPAPMIKFHKSREALIEDFKQLEGSKTILAYTNERVQAYNEAIANNELPDTVVIPALSDSPVTMEGIIAPRDAKRVQVPGDKEITPATKYNPLRVIRNITGVKFYMTEKGVVAGIYGVYTAKKIRSQVANALIHANQKYGKGSKQSKKAYSVYKSLEDYVVTIEAPYAQTIHKSQGQEFDHVLLDYSDLTLMTNKVEANRLLYVAFTRAKQTVRII